MTAPRGPHETWEPIEIPLYADGAPENPYTDESVTATFEHASGDVRAVPGFWNGGREWLVRFAPPSAGEWTWRTESDTGDAGLERAGDLSVRAYDGPNPIKRHGHLRPAERHLAHADGTPFFWLADTVWSAPAKATPEEWTRYLDARTAQGYNVVQVNSLPQHDAARPFRRLPFGEEWDLDAPRPAYFQALDGLVRAANARGVVPAMVVLWFNYVPGANADWDATFPRHPFDEEQAARWGRYLAARYGAYGTVWLVSGDWDVSAEPFPVYDAAARAVRDGVTHPVCAAHLPGTAETADPLNERDWLDVHAYQSGHHREGLGRDAPRALARRHREMAPARPVLDAEPCYENMGASEGGPRFSRKEVRVAGWESVLGGATAGLTYGGNGIWQWYREGERFDAVDWIEWMREPVPWHEGLAYPGAEDYATLKALLSSYAFDALTPAPDALAADGTDALAAEIPPDDVLLAYTPESRDLALDRAVEGADADWVHPATRQRVSATLATANATADARTTVAAPPWDDDALLVVEE